MKPASKFLLISTSFVALGLWGASFANEPLNSYENFASQEQSEIEKEREERAEQRRERRQERRERNRRWEKENSSIYINDDGFEFWDADTDEDGRVSREEYEAANDGDWDNDSDGFDKIDYDGDDYITEDELEDFIDETVGKALRKVGHALSNIGDIGGWSIDYDDHDHDYDYDFDFDFDFDDDDWDEDDWDDDSVIYYDYGNGGKLAGIIGQSVGMAMKSATIALEHTAKELKHAGRRIDRRHRYRHDHEDHDHGDEK